MSLRPMSPIPASPQPESDLDNTAKLPVLDPAGNALRGAETGPDAAVVPPAARPALTTATEGEATAAEASVTAAEGSAQVRELEVRFESVSATLQSVSARLHETQELLATRGDRLTQLERVRDEAHAALAAAEQRAATLEERVGALSAELARRESAATQQSVELQASSKARVTAEQRVAATTEELAQARALMSSAARGHAQAVGVVQDLHEARAHAQRYLESLQSLEGRRQIAESLVTEQQREAQIREAELDRLTRELAGRDSTARERSAELAQRAARIAQLEQQLSSLTATLARRDTELRGAREAAQGLQQRVAGLQTEIVSGGQRVRALEALSEQHRSEDAHQHNERSALNASLEAARSEAAAATSQVSVQVSALAEQRGRAAQLESALVTERQLTARLEDELATLRAEVEDSNGVLRSAQQERDALAQRARGLEEDLYAAEDSVHRLEAQARERGGRIEELEKSNRQWRATAEETRQALADMAANGAPGESMLPAHDEEVAPAAAPAPDGAACLLIRSDGDREIVHVLGRKTSIGRTPDNDLQIEATFVSRHHAVILASPAQTIIEDLNSTNGVQVNGRRVTRHTLRDGDQIAIGRARYRFAVRNPADKR